MDQFFITGCGRSGTTLFDKLLNAHPSVGVLSQPLPLLYVFCKQAFHSRINYSGDWMPLANYMGAGGYRPVAVTRFLSDFRVEKPIAEDVLRKQEDYSGVYNRGIDDRAFLESYQAGTLLDFHRNYLKKNFLWNKKCAYIGSKETHCEEFIPYYLSNGVKCFLIVRDPRDVVASFTRKKGLVHGGDIRPLLFYIHNWRKSVAFAVAHQGNPDYMVMRYEDLVDDAETTLSQVASFLDVDSFPEQISQGALKDQSGNAWQGNSSFESYKGVTGRSIGRYREQLPIETQRFIEATCYAELQYFSYPCSITLEQCADQIRGFVEPEEIRRDDIRKDYSTCFANRSAEMARIGCLEQVPAKEFPEELFVYSDVGAILHEAVHQKGL